MSKTAFIFPGQGAQFVGMAKDLYENSEAAKNLIDQAQDAIGVDISDIMFNGPMDALKQTDITQPAIFLHSVVLAELIKNVSPDMAAGHSLGEYSALVCAGALNAIDAVKLVRERGSAMLAAGQENPGTMAAVIGMEPAILEKICEEISKENVVQCANFNSPGQIVISGSVDGVHKAMEQAKANGARMAKELVVSGAFHSPLMSSAQNRLKAKLDETQFVNANIPVYANVTAQPVTDAAEIKDLLFKQLNAPVRWEESVVNMINDGAEKFVEIGPGKVLQGLVKRINPDVEVIGVASFQDLESYL